MIDGMALGHGDGMGGSGKGRISNKTMYIALNYQEKMDRMNAEAANEIAQRLLELEGEPVWLGGSGLNRWDIFTGGLKGGFACFLRGALPMETIGRTWTPYRRRPEARPVEREGRE